MKPRAFPAAALLAAGILASLSVPFRGQTYPGQTQTTVTTTLPSQTQTTQTTTVTTAPMEASVVPVVPIEQTVAPRLGQHVAEIEIVLTHGSVEAYFGRAPRGEKFQLGDAQFNIRLPSTATVTKLASRDKNSDGPRHVTVANPWHVLVPFEGGGRYVFNIVEWDDDPVAAEVLVKVDGAVIFEGRGSDDDFSNWEHKLYGPDVHKTGSREIAFVLQ